MGVSEGFDGGIGVDCSVGTIVWVRRRNGSWWPGRILGPHELSASHLMSPRSGTPVKLLGREDASVDWYNLEKSKRVKPFRCGEFDSCIERAEASQGIPIKKREKYARREDAILHALELEQQQKQKLGGSSNSNSHKFSGALKKELNSYSPSGLHLRNDESVGHRKFVDPKSQSLSRRVDLLPEEVNGGHTLHAQKGKNQLNWEDDNSDAIPRMRGLQDFGLRIAPSKRKLSTSVDCESSRKPVLVDNPVLVLPGSGHGIGSVNNAGSGKNSLVKRKRSQGGLTEESLVKRRDRRRPLVQVLQSSAKLLASQSSQANCDTVSVLVQEKEHMSAICRAKRSRCIYLPADSGDSLDHAGYSSDPMQISPTQFEYGNGLHQPGSLAEEGASFGWIEEDETESSDGDCLDPEIEEVAPLLPDTISLVPESRISGTHVKDDNSAFCDQEKIGNVSNNCETSLSNYKSHLPSHEQTACTSADVGMSGWHMKGKRNIRNLTKRPMELPDGKNSVTSSDKYNDGLINGTLHEGKRSAFKMGRERVSGQGYYHQGEELNYGYSDEEFLVKDSGNGLVGVGNCSYPLMLKADSRDRTTSGLHDSDEDSHAMFSPGWDDADGLPHVDRRAYWGESDECFDPLYVHPPMLVDVNLKVQASYQGEHVPLVSLMSRLNGKAIIGHPVQIEILEDGFIDSQLSRNGLGGDTSGFDESAATPPPVWRTGRRTAMQRVPRPHPAPSALEVTEADPLPYSDLEGKQPPLKKPLSAPNHQAGSTTKTSHCHRPMSGKSHNKVLRKVSLSGQKTRTLSSFATEHKSSGVNATAKLANKDGNILDGLIKSDGAVPLVTCVPVKVVFSRILEAVSRPPSAAAIHRGPLVDSAEKNPS